MGRPARPVPDAAVPGPATLRDTPARIADDFTQPFRWYDSGAERWFSLGLSFVDRRARYLPLDKTLAQTYDPYVFIRNAYLQRRLYAVYDGNPPTSRLPEEDENWDQEALQEDEAAEDPVPADEDRAAQP